MNPNDRVQSRLEEVQELLRSPDVVLLTAGYAFYLKSMIK